MDIMIYYKVLDHKNMEILISFDLEDIKFSLLVEINPQDKIYLGNSINFMNLY